MDVIKTTQPASIGDLIHSEYDSTHNTDDVVLLAGSGSARAIPQFAVVSKVTASGKFQQLEPGGTGGVQNAAGIALLAAVAADGSDGELKILARGPAVVRDETLVWPAGATDAQKASGRAALTALGIVIRPGI